MVLEDVNFNQTLSVVLFGVKLSLVVIDNKTKDKNYIE